MGRQRRSPRRASRLGTGRAVMTLRTSTASPKACPGGVRAGTLEARAGDEILEETLCAIGLPGRREGRLARREAIEEMVDLLGKPSCLQGRLPASRVRLPPDPLFRLPA